MFSGVVSGSSIVIKSFSDSGLLEPPYAAGAPVVSNWWMRWSLMSWVVLFRTSTPSCLVVAVVVFMVLPSGPMVGICLTFSEM